MKTQIDIKSALFGLGVGVFVTLVIGAASPSGPANGRYPIAGTANQGMVLDTVTGEVWSGHFPSDRGGMDHEFAKPKYGEKK